jgi:UDPglucose--hexose-1-phosphate uridylyltransferase
VETAPPITTLAYDGECYLCPGNTRAQGQKNPNYSSTFVFDNDFAALLPETIPESDSKNDLLVAVGEPGICRVVCFSPRHDLSLGAMTTAEISSVVDIWEEQYLDLGSRPFIQYVQIFENRGAMMGTSNPHPHCQIWGTSSVPNEPNKEQEHQRQYSLAHDSCLLCDYVALEIKQEERIVAQNHDFLAVVPYWATWPFEIMLLPKSHMADVPVLSPDQRMQFAHMLQKVSKIYDLVFGVPFPYSMGIHQPPTDGQDHPEWHMHVHYYPPLLRSASVRKFMVGFELLAMPQRDITPEAAAARLREIASKF